MAARVFALFLGTTTILVVSTAPHSHSSPAPAAAALHHQCIGAPAVAGENPMEYKEYIVLLRPWPDAATAGMDDDDGARWSWYLSFLPGNITTGGKPRLVRSYKHGVNGFAAPADGGRDGRRVQEARLLALFPERHRSPLPPSPLKIYSFACIAG
uniref:Inhibitor I9 domain-containing protein n=1 Tax=Oryza meridionalis TaxID=40149 RepID=A0A0E0CCL4_9ORYZ